MRGAITAGKAVMALFFCVKRLQAAGVLALTSFSPFLRLLFLFLTILPPDVMIYSV